ncbi:PorP/SprF family type IX secretion system membrane protein [Mucilaginibacter sp. HMF5004]|uniref:PorP/SprF family type IX secretion system membrane protein n=1 Tax=Mucilaginibacter rivuli TaxID=2857527 RepID=UPI001C5F0EB7|nr:PorP/SprF family type IX secretion system membrane protein [Mucilaginibacter rivuli]MBW4888968.1 PorP/SprF family type IX secretion system membrane protein [Mucilaginibacter rivuli]
MSKDKRIKSKDMTNYISINKIAIVSILCMVLILGIQQASAQLTGMQTMYYQNQYLANPAMAGMEQGLNINLGYQQQWTSVPGGPKLQNFTADYNSGNNVGLGLNVSGDNAGLINRTRVMGTYAYHLPLSDKDDKLSFGLSLGINDTYIDYTKVNGDQGDVAVQNFNQRSIYVDGDFGISYTGRKFTAQAALPNMKTLFFSNDNNNNLEVDRATFFTALSYKIHADNGISNYTLEPKIAYRGVKGFDNILDAGAQMTMNDYNINFGGMYHTNKSFTITFGVNLAAMDIMAAYSNNTGPLSVYANNTFEFGIKLKMFNK